MRNTTALIKELAEKGIKLDSNGDKLRIDGPVNVMTTELQTELRQHRDKLLAALRGGLTSSKPMTFKQAIEHFEQQGLRYELEERAAILEYGAGLGRNQAEQQAVTEMLNRKCMKRNEHEQTSK